MVRAIGSSLTGAGVPGALADPLLTLHRSDGSAPINNDNWRETQQDEIEATGIPPRHELESAIVAMLSPGNYTAVVTGKDQTSGVGLLEIYDLGLAVNSKLANISTRGIVRTGDNALIGGFIFGGTTGTTDVVVRAIGPSLTKAGINNALADPTLELLNANGATIASNNDWKFPEAQAQAIKVVGLAPTNDRESALLATLVPGRYTAIVRGNNGGIGVGLVEVYNLK
jgi:hypothetical protein